VQAATVSAEEATDLVFIETSPANLGAKDHVKPATRYSYFASKYNGSQVHLHSSGGIEGHTWAVDVVITDDDQEPPGRFDAGDRKIPALLDNRVTSCPVRPVRPASIKLCDY